MFFLYKTFIHPAVRLDSNSQPWDDEASILPLYFYYWPLKVVILVLRAVESSFSFYKTLTVSIVGCD